MSQPKKFGTFAGVFTPSILTILGVIMYLRMGWVVGNAGLIGTILIILVAHIISVSTGLSISSIATDKKVGAGGVYYVLSRSLGLPIGGSLGLALFVATAFSIALYMVGFAEIFNEYIGYGYELDADGKLIQSEFYKDSLRITGSIGLLLLTVLAFISTSIALKSQYFILAAIGLSLVSIFFGDGSISHELADTTWNGETAGFAAVFAIFFPAVTGFTAGVAMSGDLRDPKKSIPFGTIAAIAAGLVVYMILAVFIYYKLDQETLLTNSKALFQMAAIGLLVYIGVWGATLSSALGGILGGPRILQAMSMDKITPAIFAKGVGQGNEPRNALILTVIIAEAGILIGDLNIIAEVVSMFYLAAYGFINLSFFLESWASSDFNPTFKVKKWIGLIGCIATFVIMSQLNLPAMVAAFVIISGIYFYLSRKQVALGTGDIWQSVWSTIVKKGLKRMEAGSDHKRNWKPNLLLFSADQEYRTKMIEFSKAVSGQNGIITNFDLHENQEATVLFPKSKETVKDEELEKYGIFGRKLEVQNVFKGIESIACTFGFSGIEPNTVLMAWPGKTKDPIWFAEMTQKLIDLDYNVLYLDYDHRWGFRKKEKIDLWWDGVSNNSELMLLLTKFITSTPDWTQASIRILLINDTNVDYKILENRIQYVVDQFRVQAEIKIINNEVDQKSTYELMKVHSSEADLIFVGIPEIEEGGTRRFVEKTNNLVGVIGTTLLVKASSQFDETDLKVEHIAFKDESKKIEHTELLPLNKVEDEAFNKTIVELDVQLDEITATLINQSVQSVENYHQTVFSKVTEKMDEFLLRLSQDKEEEEEFDLQLSLHKVLTEVQEIYADSLENQLPLIEEMFTAETAIYLKTKEELFGYLPNKARLQTVRNADGTLATKKRKVAYRSAIQKLWLSEGLTETHQQFLEFGYNNMILLHQSKNILHNRIWEFLAAVDDQVELKQAASECKQKLDEALREVKEDALNLASNFYRNLRNNERDNLNELGEVILDPAYRKRLSEKYPVQTNKQLLSSRNGILNFPGYWYRNLILFTYHLEADIYLIQLSAQMQDFTKELNHYTTEQYLDKIEQNLGHLNNEIEKLELKIGKKDVDAICATHVQLSEEIFFNSEYIISHIVDSAAKMLEFIPDEIELMTANSINNIRESQGSEIKTEKLALKDITDYLSNVHFLDPVHEKIQVFYDQLKRSLGKLMNAALLIQNGIDSYATNNKLESLTELLEQAKSEIHYAESDIQTAVEGFRTELRDRKELLRKELDINQIIEQIESLTQYVKKQKRRNLVAESVQRANKTAGKNIRKALNYFIAKQQDISAIEYKSGFEHVISEQGTIGDFVQQISQKADLPFYYQQLFLGAHYSESQIEGNRKAEITTIQSAVKRIEAGASGAILILGTASSGKSYLTNHVAGHILKNKTFQIQPLLNKTWKKEDLTKAFQRACRSNDSLTKIMNNLPEKSVFVFHDLEQWWVKSEQGISLMAELEKLIKRFGSKHYFVLNANIYAYNQIRQHTHLQSQIIQTVVLPPLSASQIRDIIWSRHLTGGLQINVNGVNEKHLSANKINKFLSRFYNSSGGNVGLALQQWIASIQHMDENELFMDIPLKRDFPDLKKTEWKNMIYQIFIHHNLTKEELYKIYGKGNENWINRTLEALVSSTMLAINEREGYYLKKEVKPYVENWLYELGFIK
ncbi:MAG: hypothetical protein MI810_09625 [Flavobacteriales bacterium]|nr:hypothetical protein [Flavobacteriales bacterium]